MTTLNQLGSMLSEVDEVADVFIMGDQPVTCPQCGTRSEILKEWEEDSNFIQDHECLNVVCGYRFLAFSE